MYAIAPPLHGLTGKELVFFGFWWIKNAGSHLSITREGKFQYHFASLDTHTFIDQVGSAVTFSLCELWKDFSHDNSMTLMLLKLSIAL